MSVFKKIFGGKEKEKKDANFSLGTPTGFKHVGHVGYDPDKGSLEGSNLPEELSTALNAAGGHTTTNTGYNAPAPTNPGPPPPPPNNPYRSAPPPPQNDYNDYSGQQQGYDQGYSQPPPPPQGAFKLPPPGVRSAQPSASYGSAPPPPPVTRASAPPPPPVAKTAGGPPPPPPMPKAGGPPPPPPPAFKAAETHEDYDAPEPSGERNALLSSISNFKKGGLKKAQTNDRSSPILTKEKGASGGGAPGGRPMMMGMPMMMPPKQNTTPLRSSAGAPSPRATTQPTPPPQMTTSPRTPNPLPPKMPAKVAGHPKQQGMPPMPPQQRTSQAPQQQSYGAPPALPQKTAGGPPPPPPTPKTAGGPPPPPMAKAGGPPPPPPMPKAGGPPPPPPPAFKAAETHEDYDAPAPSGERNALLSSIANFKKGGLKKAQTNDRSAPIVSKEKSGGGAPSGGSRPGPPGGGGGLMGDLAAAMSKRGSPRNETAHNRFHIRCAKCNNTAMEASNEKAIEESTNDPFNEPVNSNYGYATLQIPKDEEGYVVSFDKDDVDNWRAFFDTYGIVVIRNIISDEEADRTANEVWDYLGKMLKVEKDDPSTWERWPWGKHLGILGSDLILSQQACSNREHPNMYDFFCKLYGETELYTSVDRIGMMRPTKGIKFPDKDELVDKPEWKTKSQWLHWDMNPWTGKTSMYGWQGNNPEEPHNKGFDYLMVQGILGLYDCGPEDGGFHAVPGFHKHIQAWAKANDHLRERNTYPKVYDETTVQVPRQDPIRNDIQKLPIRKGSFLIWHSAIPHGTFPNDSNRFRLIQYMKMAPASYPHVVPFYQSNSPFRPMYPFPEDIELTELGKKIYGFKPWKPAPEEPKSRGWCVLL